MDRPGFSLLVCPDNILLKQEAEKEIARYLREGVSWKRLVFWGDEEPGPSFWENLTQVGLFAENRIIIVRHAEAWNASTWKKVSSVLARQLAHVWPFFCIESPWEKNKPQIAAYIQKSACYAFAVQKKWIWQSPGLTGQSLKDFARAEAKKLGLHFTSENFALFCSMVNPEAQSILNELHKLSLLARNGNVDSDMFTPDAANLESDAFSLIRNITKGAIVDAWREVASSRDGSMLFFAIALLARELKTMWNIAAGMDVRLYPAEAARKKALAKAIGFPGIARGFAALADAEYQVKSGQQSPEQALECLTIQMTRILAGTPPGGN